LNEVGIVHNALKAKFLLLIIKLTSSGKAEYGQIAEAVRISSDYVSKTLNSLAEEGYVKIEDGFVETSAEQRVDLAVQAIKEGADVEEACKVLGWVEFEDIILVVLKYNGFEVMKHFRFKSPKRRYEVDVLGLKGGVMLSIDCKHWKKGWQRAAVTRAVDAQIERSMALAQLLPSLKDKLKIGASGEIDIIPLIITLSEAPLKTFKDVPILPVYYLQNFLNTLPAYVEELATFKGKI